MIVLSLPFDANFGWTEGWSHLSAEMQKLGSITEVGGPCGQADGVPVEFDDPVLTLLQGYNCLPLRPNAWSKKYHVGYGFPEESLLIKRYALNARRYFDYIVGGSTWCADNLRDAFDFPPVKAVIQGVDSDRFAPDPAWQPDPDKFVIYSGGKLELRKGQDVVLQAVGVMMQRHEDVHLLYDWHNPWAFSKNTLLATPFFSDIPDLSLARAFAKAGVDPGRVCGNNAKLATLDEMRTHYQQCDIGLFPNRAEAGTNMVLMQLMACGKPAIATYAHGHKDVLIPEDGLNLTHATPFLLAEQTDTGVIQKAMWFEPNLDEVVEKLDWAYEHRGALPIIGAVNRQRMQEFTWARCAREFTKICASA